MTRSSELDNVDSWADRALSAMRQFFEAMDRGDEDAENDAITQMYGLVEERME